MAKERNFMEVYRKIKRVAPKELVKVLEGKTVYWAPEIVWHNLSAYVNKYVKPDSKNAKSIAVYAVLCDCNKKEMKQRFISDGF